MLKFIDSFNFMDTKLENLVDNLSELYTCDCVDNICNILKYNMINTIYKHLALYVTIIINKKLNLS